jgi:dihydrodipicolinate synthase/N-acetylneuraminate lyase
MQISGMFMPVPTPFEEDGSIDVPMFEEIIDTYIATGVDALMVAGSFGNGPAMSQDERKKIATLAIARVRGRVPLIVHCGTADPYTAIDLAEHAMKGGADGVAFVGPYYYSDHSPEEVRLHFKQIGRSIKAPIMLYNNPSYQGYKMTPEMMLKMCEDTPNIFGAKLAMGGVADVHMHRMVLGEDFGIYALSGSLMPGMLIGQTGAISPPLAARPDLGVALVRAMREKDYERARELQVAVLDFEGSLREPAVRREAGRGVQLASLREFGFKIKKYPRWPTGEFPAHRKEWIAEIHNRAKAALAVPVAH